MKRRTAILGLGGLVAGGGAAMGTGAFTNVEADREVSVDVQNDQNSYLALEPVDTDGDTVDEGRAPEAQSDPFAVIDEDTGRLNLNITALNSEAETVIDNVFQIANFGTDEVTVTIEQTGTNEEVLSFEDQDGNSLDEGEGVDLDDGESLIVRIIADTAGVDPGDDIIDSITVVGNGRGDGS